jgi:hypothetical protein
VRLGAPEETPGERFHFQITRNSLMGSTRSHEADIAGETPEARRIPLQGSAFLLAFGDFFDGLAIPP